MARPLLPVRHHATIAAAEAGDVQVCASVGPAGEVIAVWSAAEDLPVLTSFFPDPPAPSCSLIQRHWPISISQNAVELVRRLIALNAEIIKGTRSYDPFGEF